MLYLIVRFLAIILFSFFFRLETFGQKNIPLKGGFILASNHASYLDPPILGAACPRVLTYFAKKELFRNVFFSWLITNLNAFPDRDKSGHLVALRRAIRELKAGKGLVIFPEGRRTEDGKLDEPMEGVGLLAVKTVVPIVPAFIDGSNKALPKHSKFIRFKKIKVSFGQAFWTEDIGQQLKGRSSYQAIAEKVMKEIKSLRDQHN